MVVADFFVRQLAEAPADSDLDGSIYLPKEASGRI